MPSSAVRTFTEPDAFHAAIRDVHAEGVVSGRGNFHAEWTSIRLNRLSIQRGEEGLARVSYSAIDPELSGIVFATFRVRPYIFTASNRRTAVLLSTVRDRRVTIGPGRPVNGAPSL